MFPLTTRYVDIDGTAVHVADFGGSGPPVVCVHGLGGSYANWGMVAGHLGDHGHVTAPDLPGFGLTAPQGRSCSVEGNRSVLHRYLESLGEPAMLVANSMGGAIAISQAAAAPETVSSLVLISPALPRAPGGPWDPLVSGLFALYLLPGAGRLVLAGRRLIWSPEEAARFTIQLCTAHPARIPPDVVEHHVEVARRRAEFEGADQGFITASRSLLRMLADRRGFDSRVAAISAPTLVIHGESDRLVPAHSAMRLSSLRPDWSFEMLEDVGHIAMLEVPVTVGRLIDDWTKG